MLVIGVIILIYLSVDRRGTRSIWVATARVWTVNAYLAITIVVYNPDYQTQTYSILRLLLTCEIRGSSVRFQTVLRDVLLSRSGLLLEFRKQTFLD